MPSPPGYDGRVIVLGTSGWQYRDWRGDFYPAGLPQRAWLEYFAGQFASVEVNNAFYRLPDPIMGAEDFAYVLDRVPGAMLFLGVAPQGDSWASCCGIHSSRMMIDEAVLPQGAALLAGLAQRFLAEGFGR